ncbi:prolipoprotein diacylglyceryl transferase [Candidatus Woesearchaeota archaeon]|jgi:phosphatidylglycerol---prolipoprotein diacylglyceryl transferase|nr:prolipoprotein diacylglyceryl transferase [Candidatus Woesearchaeota archaeon]MBT4368294.1 prolipoprotein diacylglyceryl transferase [Candidatus Woesearchaeota archaeon]MBT4712783.1 prolipoprotein diacylglyceryl transferase [Candidatus Woesearchaeota archaeon]MBT6639695.1 prolipoprotein diacylglyceryl transferase [Candidatus Woesearchaeota archaeon]MBT7133867.1 prolipoprotein diacylglyceryl transferase [Candidatus Woesearchaeota archaeon]
MFTHTLNPILLQVGALEIRWYGLMYVIAFIITYFFILKFSKKFGLELSKDDVGDFVLYSVVLMVICARLVEVLFYNPSYYFSDLSKIFAIWEGGLSFHGGLLGIVLAGWLFSKKKKISFLKLADLVSLPAVLGLMLGRLGNFINGELVGRITSVPWCFNFRGYEGCRHPSQLYEAGKNLLIFLILFPMTGKKKDGFIFFLFLILYAVFRSIIEQYWRMPARYILGLTEGQFLNVFILVIGLIGMWWIHRKTI